LQVPLFQHPGAPHDYRLALAPRLGIAYALGRDRSTVIRAGAGLYYNDLAQNGWVTAFQAVNEAPALCVLPSDAGCLPGAANGGAGAIIDPVYKTPYALDASAGVERSFHSNWMIGADWTHETGMHGYRRYQYEPGYTLFSPLFASDVATQQANVPSIAVFRTDNRSVYDGLSIHLQGKISRASVMVNYTLSRADTWGCVLGELFDYVNGVCNPVDAFAKGDYGPSGEDVTHRLVIAGTVRLPGGLELSLLSQAESARPFTMTTPVDVNALGDPLDDRAVVKECNRAWTNSAARLTCRPTFASAGPSAFANAGRPLHFSKCSICSTATIPARTTSPAWPRCRCRSTIWPTPRLSA
jgi:hypothetical protein